MSSRRGEAKVATESVPRVVRTAGSGVAVGSACENEVVAKPGLVQPVAARTTSAIVARSRFFLMSFPFLPLRRRHLAVVHATGRARRVAEPGVGGTVR